MKRAMSKSLLTQGNDYWRACLSADRFHVAIEKSNYRHMKTANGRTFFPKPLTAMIMAAMIAMATISCDKSDDEDPWVPLIGTWHQTSKTIDGIAAVKDSSRLLMQINQSQICILCDSSHTAVTSNKIVKRSGWSYTNGLLNIAIDLPASWKPTTTEQTLMLERIDFKTDGGISKTVVAFERIADLEIQ
jgi:hypothetical protein